MNILRSIDSDNNLYLLKKYTTQYGLIILWYKTKTGLSKRFQGAGEYEKVAGTRQGVWGPPRSPAGYKGSASSGDHGAQKQSRFEVFALVEIGYHEPESNANKRSICFLMKINSQIFFPFHYSLRCHVLLHDRSIYFCLQLQCLLFHSRIFYNYNRSFLELHCVIGTCAIQTLKQN